MSRTLHWAALAMTAFLGISSVASAEETRGCYVESRTCQVYTGPCFANGEVGAAGRNAIMAWSIEEGRRNGVDLSGLNVVVVVGASDTLGFQGLDGPKHVKSVILVDQRATSAQKRQLIGFAKEHAGRAGKAVLRIDDSPIAMNLNVETLEARLQAGKSVALQTRKARPGDCICSNESAYYPPLAKVTNFVPGVTIEGRFSGRGLGARWSTPGDRSAYMALFQYE